MLNNKGYALHQLSRFDEALVAFEAAVELREAAGNTWTLHVARWMVAWTLRAMGKTEAALAIQHQLEAERDAVGEPDASVYEELEVLYRMQGETKKAQHYAQLGNALSSEVPAPKTD